MNISFWFKQCRLNAGFLSTIYERYSYTQILVDSVRYIVPGTFIEPCPCGSCHDDEIMFIILRSDDPVLINKLYYGERDDNGYNRPVAIELKFNLLYLERDTHDNIGIYGSARYITIKYTFLHPFIGYNLVKSVHEALGFECILYMTTVFDLLQGVENKSMVKLHVVKNVYYIANGQCYIDDIERITNIIHNETSCLPYHIHTSRVVYDY